MTTTLQKAATITLPDCAQRHFDHPVSVAQVAQTIGPVIDDGFYYDIAYERPFTPSDLDSLTLFVRQGFYVTL